MYKCVWTESYKHLVRRLLLLSCRVQQRELFQLLSKVAFGFFSLSDDLVFDLFLTMPSLFFSIDKFARFPNFVIEFKLQLWRTVDPNSTDTLHPGVVTTDNIRQKLSKQLKIDLDESEPIHILRNTTSNENGATSTAATATTTSPLNFAELDDAKIQAMADELVPVTDASGKCSIQINRLGEYLAVIGLKGGYAVPLRVLVRQRA